MKNSALTLFLYLSLFTACNTYAGNNTLLSDYPANGSYGQVTITNPPNTTTAPACTQGLLFMDPVTKAMEICTANGAVPVPYPETCFNRFSSNSGILTGNNCPTGYIQAPADTSGQFQTDSSHTVYYIVCCATGITTNSNPTVLPS